MCFATILKDNFEMLFLIVKKCFKKRVVKAGILTSFLACIIAWSGTDLQKYGPLNLVLNSSIMKCNHDRNLNLDVSGIKIFFYDFVNGLNASFPIQEAADGILALERFNKSRPFVMFVGGFTSHINHTIEEQMKKAYVTQPNTYLIIPDHSQYTNNQDGDKQSYQRSVTHVHYIGTALGKMLGDLRNAGVNPKNIHCTGHSLGGQMLGHTGTAFQNKTGERISKITALDPAGPCFASSAVENQVRSGVADYVEVYHSNSGALGSASILGDVDFLMNRKGEVQPHCGTPVIPLIYLSSKAASCNHRAAVDFWTAAVKYPTLFTGYKCDSYENFQSGFCVNNNKTVAGSKNPGKALGVYYLPTEKYNLKELM